RRRHRIGEAAQQGSNTIRIHFAGEAADHGAQGGQLRGVESVLKEVVAVAEVVGAEKTAADGVVAVARLDGVVEGAQQAAQLFGRKLRIVGELTEKGDEFGRVHRAAEAVDQAGDRGGVEVSEHTRQAERV